MKLIFLCSFLTLSSFANADSIDCKIMGKLSATPERVLDGTWKPDLPRSSVEFNFESKSSVSTEGTPVTVSLEAVLRQAISTELLSFDSVDAVSLSSDLLTLVKEVEPQLTIRYLSDVDMVSPVLLFDTNKLKLDQTGSISPNMGFRSTAGKRKATNPNEFGYTIKGFRIYLGDGKMQYAGNLTVRTNCE